MPNLSAFATIKIENEHEVKQTLRELETEISTLTRQLNQQIALVKRMKAQGSGVSAGTKAGMQEIRELKQYRQNRHQQKQQVIAGEQYVQQQFVGAASIPAIARVEAHQAAQKGLLTPVPMPQVALGSKREIDQASRAQGTYSSQLTNPTLYGSRAAAATLGMGKNTFNNLAQASNDPTLKINRQAVSDYFGQLESGARELHQTNQVIVRIKRLSESTLPALEASIMGTLNNNAYSRRNRQTVKSRFARESADIVETVRGKHGNEAAQKAQSDIDAMGEHALRHEGAAEIHEKSRKLSDAVKNQRSKIEEGHRYADWLEANVSPEQANKHRQKIAGEEKKLSHMSFQANEAANEAAASNGSDWHKVKQEAVFGMQDAAKYGHAAEEKRKLGEAQEDTQWAKDKVGSVQSRFDKIDGLIGMRKDLKSQGLDTEADGLQREIHRQALEARKQTEALDRLSKALLRSDDPRERKRGFELHDQLSLGGEAKKVVFESQADKLMQNYGELGGGFGKKMAHGIGRIPIIGELSNFLGAEKIGKVIDKTPIGRYSNGFMNGLKGGEKAVAATTELEGAGAAANGARMGATALGVMSNPVTLALAGVAAVVGGGMYLSARKANADVEGTKNARDEEASLGDLGNKLGTSDRLMDDIRTKNGKSNGGLTKEMIDMRMTSQDYGKFLGSADITNMTSDQRKQSGMTALHLARNFGMDAGQVGSVAHDISLGDRHSGANLNQDLTRFGAVLSEGIKRGVGSDETTRAFTSALDRARSNGSGVLGESERQGLMSQLLAASQTGNQHLAGQNGADFISGANDKLAGAQGKDLAFVLRSFGTHKGSELGMDKDDAAMYDKLRKSSPTEAARFAQGHVTPQMQALQVRHMLGSSGGNVERVAAGLRSTLGVESATAAEAAQDIEDQTAAARKKTGKKNLTEQQAWDMGLIDEAHLTSLVGRTKPGSSAPIDGSGEAQKNNGLYQVSERQEIRMSDAKIHAERVTLESSFSQRNAENQQNWGNSVSDTRQGLVQGGGNAIIESVNPNKDAPVPTGGIQAHADGGYITGPGTDKSDSILARLSNGEFVVKGEQTRKHRALLEQINSGSLPAYANGGHVGSSATLGGGSEIAREERKLSDVLERLIDRLDKMGTSSPLAQMQMFTPQSGSSANSTGGIDGIIPKVKDWFGSLVRSSQAPEAPQTGTGVTGVGSQTAPQSSSTGLGGVKVGGAGTTGIKIAKQAMDALNDPRFTSAAYQCSVFARQVTEHAAGLKDHALSGSLFGGSAIETGQNFAKKGWGKSLKEMEKQGQTLHPGDLVFQMSGSGNNGHVGVVAPDGKHIAENTTRGQGQRGYHAKQYTDISKWGHIDLVGRVGGFGKPDGDKVGAASPTAKKVGAASPTARKAAVPDSSERERFINAEAQQESGGRYDQVNRRTGAMGKYQVMPQNITGWGKQAGKKGVGWDYEALGYDITPQQYLKSPELQEKISRFQLGKAYDKHGAVGAARFWYSGKAGSSDHRPATGEPTPNEYANQVLGRMGHTSGVTAAAPSAQSGVLKVEVSGNVTINGQPDPKLRHELARRAIHTYVSGAKTASRRAPAVSARAG